MKSRRLFLQGLMAGTALAFSGFPAFAKLRSGKPVNAGRFADLQKAIDAAGAGGTLKLPAKTYTLNDSLVFHDNMTIRTDHAVFDASAITDDRVPVTLGANIRWHGTLEIKGPGKTPSSKTKKLLHCTGINRAPEAPVFKKGPNIDTLILHDAPGSGVMFEYVEGYFIGKEIIHDFGYAGHMDISCRNYTITDQHIYGEPSGFENNAYCYSATRDYGSLKAFPRNSDGTIFKALHEDNRVWHALDSHAAQRLNIHDLHIRNCKRGVLIGASKNALGPDGYYAFGSRDITLHKVLIEKPYSPEAEGILISGAYANDSKTVTERTTNIRINGGHIADCGWDNNRATGAVWVRCADAVIENTVIERPRINGILLQDHADVHLNNVTITDPHHRKIPASYVHMDEGGNRLHVERGTRFLRRMPNLDLKVGIFGVSQAAAPAQNKVFWAADALDESIKGHNLENQA